VKQHLNKKGKIVVGHDPELRRRLISIYHDTALRRHFGIRVTTKGCESYSTKRGYKDKVIYMRECLVCQKNKLENILPPGLLQPLSIPHALFTDINMDFIEGLPKSNDKEIIFVVVDRFNKHSHFMVFSHSYYATTIYITFMDHVYKLHGLPIMIISDKDIIFLSHFWKISLHIKEWNYTIL
jgi:hypothetical protein